MVACEEGAVSLILGDIQVGVHSSSSRGRVYWRDVLNGRKPEARYGHSYVEWSFIMLFNSLLLFAFV